MTCQGNAPGRFLSALSLCRASARRGRATFNKRHGVLNQPLARMMAVPGAAHHEPDR
jgi:hypothetical protein